MKKQRFYYKSKGAIGCFVKLFPPGEQPPRSIINNVGDECFLQNGPAAPALAGVSSACWPMKSTAMGVHPSQRKDAYEESVKIGVETQFDGQGDAVFESAGHRKRYCRAKGVHDKNAGYSDPTPD